MGRGRLAPYTEIGLRRLSCIRCGKPATTQWQVCADGNVYRPLCRGCDVELNAMVLEWMGDGDVGEKMAKYVEAAG